MNDEDTVNEVNKIICTLNQISKYVPLLQKSPSTTVDEVNKSVTIEWMSHHQRFGIVAYWNQQGSGWYYTKQVNHDNSNPIILHGPLTDDSYLKKLME
jgi:hypothetical protein